MNPLKPTAPMSDVERPNFPYELTSPSPESEKAVRISAIALPGPASKTALVAAFAIGAGFGVLVTAVGLFSTDERYEGSPKNTAFMLEISTVATITSALLFRKNLIEGTLKRAEGLSPKYSRTVTKSILTAGCAGFTAGIAGAAFI